MSRLLRQMPLCSHLGSGKREQGKIRTRRLATTKITNKKIEGNFYISTWAMKRTRDVWPVSSAIFTIDGYFHRVSWFCVKPWELRSSRSFLFQSRAQTCEPVSTEFRQAPVWVFQNLMHRSPPPPPEASKLPWKGHHASAFTAAVWSSILWSHCVGEFEDAEDLSQMCSKLSLPPLASCCPEADHFSPHTSCRCPL